jgi:hypothetical protein
VAIVLQAHKRVNELRIGLKDVFREREFASMLLKRVVCCTLAQDPPKENMAQHRLDGTRKDRLGTEDRGCSFAHVPSSLVAGCIIMSISVVVRVTTK